MSGNACWHKLCGLQALHPIVGTAEPASFARGAGVRPAREQMLSRFVLVVPLVFAYCALIYEWGEWSDLPTPFSSRVCSPVFCPPHAFSSRAAPFLCPGEGGMGAPPPWLRTALALPLRDSEAPLTFRAQKRAAHQHRSSVVLIVKGRGRTPMFAHGPWPSSS